MSYLDGHNNDRRLPRDSSRNVWIGAAVGAAIIIAAVAWAYHGARNTADRSPAPTGLTGQASGSSSSTTTGAPASK